jgi:uncharacterized 2Fe-2S/4Fe-4S cluster protein (DUF4445 family)
VSTTHRIVFTPSGLSGTVEHGTTVLEAARVLGVDLDTVCGGRGICGRCQVLPGAGNFAKWGITVEPGALGDPAVIETDYRGNRPLAAGNRLGCAAQVCGDVVIDVPATSQVHRQVVRKDLDLPPITVDPSFTLWYVEVPRIELGGPGDDLTAASAIGLALAEQHGRTTQPSVPFGMLGALHLAPVLRRERREASIAVEVGMHGGQIEPVGTWQRQRIDLRPADHEQLFNRPCHRERLREIGHDNRAGCREPGAA